MKEIPTLVTNEQVALFKGGHAKVIDENRWLVRYGVVVDIYVAKNGVCGGELQIVFSWLIEGAIFGPTDEVIQWTGRFSSAGHRELFFNLATFGVEQNSAEWNPEDELHLRSHVLGKRVVLSKLGKSIIDPIAVAALPQVA